MNGVNYDASGKVVPNRSLDSHIPQEGFDPAPFETILPE